MTHLILGTAGHIDHGKTALVKALTGIDTDRLKEEKARGITIELGFAHLDLPGGVRLGVVDVPGHERFVRTMVAGVGGINLALLVIAADEGIMPQTREHLDILRLLGITRGLVVLTKCDLVSGEEQKRIAGEIRAFTTGTFLEHAPLVPVSSRNGEGLDMLKRELARLAETVTPKRREGAFRLPVDRVFTRSGFGTVVTGSLLAGEIRVGDEVELLPSGHTGKVRGIQNHGAALERGQAGQRLAVNLQGIGLDEIRRGDALVPPGACRATRVMDVRLEYLASAPRELKQRATLRFHSGTGEVSARVTLLDRTALKPGEWAFARLHLDRPLLLLAGDPYLLRLSSPAATLGGGVVLDPFPSRHRISGRETVELLGCLNDADYQSAIPLMISASLLTGMDFQELILRSGAPRKLAEEVLARLLAEGGAIQMTKTPRLLLSRPAFEELKRKLMNELATYLKANPLREGVGKEELKSRLPKRSDDRFFAPLLRALEREGLVTIDRELIRPASGTPHGAGETFPESGELLACLGVAGCAPPTAKELAVQLKRDEKGVRDELETLARKGLLTRVSHELYYDNRALAALRKTLRARLQEAGGITPGEYRDLTGLSRKHLIPLLAHFDSEKLTLRVGEKRILRKPAGEPS